MEGGWATLGCPSPRLRGRSRFGAAKARPSPLHVFSLPAASVAQTCSLSVSPEIVAAREDFFNHGWTRINTDEDRLSLIRVHPCSSVVGTYWLRLRRAALYRRFAGAGAAALPEVSSSPPRRGRGWVRFVFTRHPSSSNQRTGIAVSIWFSFHAAFAVTLSGFAMQRGRLRRALTADLRPERGL